MLIAIMEDTLTATILLHINHTMGILTIHNLMIPLTLTKTLSLILHIAMMESKETSSNLVTRIGHRETLHTATHTQDLQNHTLIQTQMFLSLITHRAMIFITATAILLTVLTQDIAMVPTTISITQLPMIMLCTQATLATKLLPRLTHTTTVLLMDHIAMMVS